MKPIKMLGLAMLAALTAMAFVGASSAMATDTALCTEDELPCEEANLVKHVHEETQIEEGETARVPAELLSSAGNVICDALFLGDVLSPYLSKANGPWLTIHGEFTYTNCTRNESACTVTEVSEDSLIEVLKLSSEEAEVIGEGEVNVHCGLFINCTYNGEGLKGHGLGPLLNKTDENGGVTISEQETKKVSGLCPEEAFLDIETLPLEPVYISS